jgi:DNA helicase-2/ATP-dependent DNA helicase PcrA
MSSSSGSIFDLLATLNKEQRLAAEHGDGPAMVLAGAGSGKTRVLTTRVAYLLATKKIDPSSILLVTFTNKAANEMTRRVQEMTGKQLNFSGTFHRLCAKILRKDGRWIGLSPQFSIYDEDDQLDLIKSILKTMNISPKEANPRLLLSMISNAKVEMLSPDDYDQFARGKYQELTSKVYREYEKRLAKADAVDFDNLLNKTANMFQRFPQVLKKYQEQFEYVLVDEYQDVNKVQYLLSKILAAPQNNLFVVGDFAQNIYSWRGADYRNMMLLKQDFPHIVEYRLERNYRSTQAILDAATAVISNNTSHPILQLWTERPTTQKIVIYEAESDREETQFVVRCIQDALATVSLKDMAVLYRTNAQSRSIEDACIRAGIPYKLVGGVRFYARKEIKDVLSYMRVATNPQDEMAMGRIEKLGKRKLQVFLEWREKEKNLPTKPLDMLDVVLEASKYKETYDPKIEEDIARLENIQELRSVASEFDTMESFFENVSLVESEELADRSRKNKDEPAITLMSVHAAKGLEFAIVFMIGMEEGLFPHSRSLMDKHQLEEERRLAYVGITRAKDQLLITYTRRRLLYGTITGSIVSRFVAEIPAELIERKGGRVDEPSTTRSRYRVLQDGDSFDQFLKGEIDVDTFLG